MCGVPTTRNTRTYSYGATVAGLSCSSKTRGQTCTFVTELLEGCYYDEDGSLLCFGTATTPAEICDYNAEGSTTCSAYITTTLSGTSSITAEPATTSASAESVSTPVTSGPPGQAAAPSQTSEGAATGREDAAYLMRGTVGGVVIVAAVAALWRS